MKKKQTKGLVLSIFFLLITLLIFSFWIVSISVSKAQTLEPIKTSTLHKRTAYSDIYLHQIDYGNGKIEKVYKAHIYAKPINIFDTEKNEYIPFTDAVNFTWHSSQNVFLLAYKNTNITIKPLIIDKDNNEYTINEIKSIYPELIFNYEIKKSKAYKYGITLENIPQELQENIKYITFSVQNLEGLTLNDIKKKENSLIIKDKIKLFFGDIPYFGFTLNIPDKTTILIENVSNKDNIIIDPTVTLDDEDTTEDGHVYYYYDWERVNLSTTIYIGYDYSFTYRAYIEFNTSSIPDNAEVLNTTLNITFSSLGSQNCNINEIETRPSQAGNEQLYNDIGNGTSYIGNGSSSNFCSFSQGQYNHNLDLGQNAYSDLQSRLSDDWFAVGIKWSDETYYGYLAHMHSSESTWPPNNPYLIVTYDTEPPTTTLNSPENGKISTSREVSFNCSATDDEELKNISLFLRQIKTKTAYFRENGAWVNATNDTMLNENNPNQNYGSETSINVDGQTPHAHTVIKFPNIFGSENEQIPLGSKIIESKLILKVYNAGNDMKAYRLKEDWVESQANWNERKTGIAWSDLGAYGSISADTSYSETFSGTAGTHNYDITRFVQNWSNGLPNYGIVLIDTGTDGVDFYSSENSSENRPLLKVSYVDTIQYYPYKVYIENYSEWKYNDSNAWPGNGWYNTDYDDSAWPEGAAYLATSGETAGVGHNTTLAGGSPAYPTYYFRKNFTIEDASNVINMSFNIDYDDAWAVYINGHFINSSNSSCNWENHDFATCTPYPHNSLIDGSGASNPKFPKTTLNSTHLSYLVDGTNYIAVAIKQGSATSSDAAFMLNLYGNEMISEDVTGTSNFTQFNVTLEDNSTYEWNCLTYDQVGNSDWADENWTLYLPFPAGFYQYPTVSFYNETTEIIRFEANMAVNGTVEYWHEGGAVQIKPLPEHKIAHEFNITGLTKGTKYYYRINITNISGGFAYFDSFNSSFKTSDDDLTSFSFAVVGDMRAQSGIGVQADIFSNITARIININPDFVINVGDATDIDHNDYNEAREAWKEYTDVVWNLTDHIPIFISIGNHEEPDLSQALRRYREVVIHPLNGDGMMERWNETTYWFRYGNSLFISLNTEERNETTNYENSIVGNQLDWLNETLNMTGFINKFVFLHRPVKGTSRNILNQEELDQMFDYYNVTAVFTGHEHYYCRNNTATLYIITGGGGAPLVSPGSCVATNNAKVKEYHFVNITVSGNTIHGNAINMSNGAVLDTFQRTTPS